MVRPERWLLVGAGVVAVAQEPAPPPTAAQLAAARGPALAAVVDLVHEQDGGQIDVTLFRLFAKARAATDPATSFLLFDAAIDLAIRAGDLGRANRAIAEQAQAFAIDRPARMTELLLALQGVPATPPLALCVAALDELQRGWLAGVPPMPRLADVAARAAARTEDPWLQAHVAAELAARRTPAAPAEPFAELALPQLLDLAGRETDRPRRRALWLAARERVLADDNDEPAARAAQARALAAITAGLCDRDGITRLRFSRAEDLAQLAVVRGEWQVVDGQLRGVANGTGNYATHRLPFASIRSVVIRGGIRSDAGLNFRCMVGPVNLLLNWEVADENHLWYHGRRDARGPRALTQGKECTIGIHDTPAGVLVFLDEQLWWQAPAGLGGTVTVYPSLGSEVFVREILVDGQLQAAAPATGPGGNPM
ncbi:MAG: hypothetical protein IPK26_30160 [Planctomycetes bacterium]|nr:hypothetical protein [Planctomycetota bacterium]